MALLTSLDSAAAHQPTAAYLAGTRLPDFLQEVEVTGSVLPTDAEALSGVTEKNAEVVALLSRLMRANGSVAEAVAGSTVPTLNAALALIQSTQSYTAVDAGLQQAILLLMRGQVPNAVLFWVLTSPRRHLEQLVQRVRVWLSTRGGELGEEPRKAVLQKVRLMLEASPGR